MKKTITGDLHQALAMARLIAKRPPLPESWLGAPGQMLTFLFWNFKSTNTSVLSNLVREHGVDVLVLAECPVTPGGILTALNSDSADYYYVQSDCDKIQLYTRFLDKFVLPVKRKDGTVIKGKDYTIRRLALLALPEVLLCGAHFPSKLRYDLTDQTAFAFGFGRVLAEAESQVRHGRTILVGDLNMNPYDDGVVVNHCLHAVPTRRIASKRSRRFKFEGNPYFYNPMWAHFGEQIAGHAGTFYLDSPKARADFWNIYDQVLVRPDVLPYFLDDDVKVVWSSATTSLLNNEGIPDKDACSDHLPILFRLRLPIEVDHA